MLDPLVRPPAVPPGEYLDAATRCLLKDDVPGAARYAKEAYRYHSAMNDEELRLLRSNLGKFLTAEERNLLGARLRPGRRYLIGGDSYEFRRVAHALIAFLVGLVGGFSARMVYARTHPGDTGSVPGTRDVGPRVPGTEPVPPGEVMAERFPNEYRPFVGRD